MSVFDSNCFEAKFTYFITTINADGLAESTDSFDFFNSISNQVMRNVLTLETLDDLRDLNEFSDCRYDELPQEWPTTGSFEAVLTPRI